MSKKVGTEIGLFQKVFEKSPVGMIICDSTGQCVTANEAFAKIIGGSVEQILKLNCFRIESWKESGLLDAALDASNTGKSINKEFCLTSTFGHKFNANVYITPFENEGANNLLFVFDDIGTIVDDRQALYLSEEKYRQLAEHLEEVLWTVSPDWNELHYINPAYEKVWGKSCQSLYDNPRSWLDSVVKEDQPKLIETINNVDFSKGYTVVFPEYRIERPDGEIRWIVATGYPLKNEEGEVVKVAGIAFDNTNQKRMELDKIKLITQLQSSLDKIKVLTGLVPICSACKQIRDDKGFWNQLEDYLKEHSDLEFTHSICPKCAKRLYPDFYSNTPQK